MGPTVSRYVMFVVLAALFATGCNEAKKGYDEAYCSSFATSFNKSCVDACAAKGATRDACDPLCKEELPKQTEYASRCKK